MKIKTYFDNIKNEIIKEINLTKKTIRIALAYFTDNEIFDALCSLSENGKDIEIVLSNDDMNFIDSSFNFERFYSSGGKCYFQNNGLNTLIHHKFAIIDSDTVITGSYNWTNNAQKNRENIVIITDENVIKNYVDEFEYLKKISSKDYISGKITKSISSLISENSNVNFFPTTYSDLDKIIEGFKLSEVTLIAGRRTTGTSSLMLNLCVNLASKQKIPTGLFSLELNSNELLFRFLNIAKNQDLSENDKKQWLKSLPIYIDDRAALSIDKLRSSIKQMIEKYDIKLFFIDNLDYLKISDKSFSEINKFQFDLNNELITKELRIIAKTFNVSIVLLSQLTKTVEMRSGDKRPSLNDFSGDIGNYVDKIIFLHRPEIHGIMEDAEGNSTKDLAELIVALNKNGETGDIALKFDSKCQTFSKYEHDFQTMLDDEFTNLINQNSFNNDLEAPF